MKLDEFEQELRQQPSRSIPVEWRKQILHTAIGSESSVSVRESSFSWRELFWPSPRAWAGLAAVWAGILVLHTASGDSPSTRAGQSQPAQPSPQLLMVLEQQWQLRAELMDIPGAEASPRAEPARPRSELAGANRNA